MGNTDKREKKLTKISRVKKLITLTQRGYCFVITPKGVSDTPWI